MLSSRRGYYKAHSRQYYKKKRINNKFSPALYKHQIPTYYQQKGRIIQTTPYFIPHVPSSLPNVHTLDKMYQALVKANYPGVSSSPIQFPLLVRLNSTLDELFDYDPTLESSAHLDSAYLRGVLSNLNLPTIPDGYSYKCGLISISLGHPSGYDNTSWEIYWNTPIASDPPVTLITKNVNSNFVHDQNNLAAFAVPVDSSTILLYKIGFNNTGMISLSSAISTSSDPHVNNNRYPLVTSLENDTSYLVMNRTADTHPIGNITLLIQIQAVSDS